MRITRGKGYVGADKNKRTDDVIGVIPMDSIFNPVTNVTWKVEPIATSTEEQERLIMEVNRRFNIAERCYFIQLVLLDSIWLSLCLMRLHL